jgi:N-methylhydantoinase B
MLDDDGFAHRDVRIAVSVTLRGGRAHVSFRGTSPQVRGGLNANLPVTLSAVFYVFRALAVTSIPANEGLMRPIRVDAPAGSVVNAEYPAAVAAGNVETSQRIVDALLRALALAVPGRVPAASAGSMNNVAVGGIDLVRRRPFSYYETIAGGAGASAAQPGASCLHTHMTNTLNTPIEGLESCYPLRVTTYGRRWHSGGRGLHSGGDGVVREIEFLGPAHVTIVSERRRHPPYGLAGGAPGRVGRNVLIEGNRRHRLDGKVDLEVESGTRLRIETPGGGGWGRPKRHHSSRRPPRA